MDRENIWARGWSHVLSTTNDVAELRKFCRRVGAPPVRLASGQPSVAPPRFEAAPRERALARPDVRVFERTSDMLRYLKALPRP